MSVQGSIVIGGGAFAGLALALALRQGLGPEIPVIVADPALSTRPSRDPRATAIVAACRRLFEAIGAWDDVRGEAQPILDMIVTDSKLEDATRPAFLNFAGDVAPGEPFAHMVENRRLIDALVVRAEAEGIDLRATTVSSYDARAEGIDVTLGDGSVIAASLLVAADGAKSKLRERAGIATHGWEYDQSGIVVTVGHERDHEGRAEEHFLPAGPFAILPLSGKRSSLVWTERRSEAARIIALRDEEFHGELEQRFGLHLGEVKVLDKPRAFPLSYFVARSFIAQRLALVGDSAHVIHPIAGQGLNMGLKDVAALAEVVVDAARLGMDIGGVDVLERYQRWRRFDTMAMGVATNSLNFLFSNQSTLLRTVRDIGLGLVDRAPPLKNLFIRQAAGLTGEIPRLLKGEAL
ncbi:MULTISPECIES: ubiquinone biosynthesis hydroxylase [Bradyrhizobium]|uniref:ubiquinone biosynthesis hydroxylase n=1 Tax=Bradyrhizobium TaxID=374 RepID=UPI000A190A4C|nr:ubiquinone biosynthesis hydroxylase [Bradyrhizobium canariense]OSI29524.1 2-octaprenyl-6-methoxyphenyl hydroxylase [Bradyrhizobium canariense]OSI32909.1 2-octaprenyl-6-methoxyphenyl hydroxylase [Bradyrhizobium canariense]OSI43593.1 2-octaprenyl-6-methoxyphenyl hydroxylase [Bradyrhizobium canariense]OSI52283.1 2-octaprenyl-6-methoxyphenyl hydroxylase [Bradyrhizobium canariense]OSI54614.1 2-octaprenyl-6-methoxyphenyl hydroxylase [Bradyrhizobium canariense]